MRPSFLAAALSVAAMSIGCDASFPDGPTSSAPVVAIQLQYPAVRTDPRVGSTFSYRLFTVNADGVYEDVTAQAGWLSSDPLVARSLLSSPQTFLAVGAGATDIVGTYQSMTASITGFVRPNPEPYPYLEFQGLGTPPLGSFANVRLVVQDTPTTSRDVTTIATWTSGDASVVAVTPGRLDGVGIGTTRVTASFGGLTAGLSVSVRPRGAS